MTAFTVTPVTGEVILDEITTPDSSSTNQVWQPAACALTSSRFITAAYYQDDGSGPVIRMHCLDTTGAVLDTFDLPAASTGTLGAWLPRLVQLDATTWLIIHDAGDPNHVVFQATQCSIDTAGHISHDWTGPAIDPGIAHWDPRYDAALHIGDQVVIRCDDANSGNHLVALNAADGTLAWTQLLPWPNTGQAFLTPGSSPSDVWLCDRPDSGAFSYYPLHITPTGATVSGDAVRVDATIDDTLPQVGADPKPHAVTLGWVDEEMVDRSADGIVHSGAYFSTLWGQPFTPAAGSHYIAFVAEGLTQDNASEPGPRVVIADGSRIFVSAPFVPSLDITDDGPGSYLRGDSTMAAIDPASGKGVLVCGLIDYQGDGTTYPYEYSTRAWIIQAPGGTTPPLRWRQRSDGLGAGAPRHRQVSTIQGSLRTRGIV